ncbi:MAG: hydroxymethylbilane synthase [Anaerolineae bacterium]|nr:hydroxymethylbilane synthase [Anaerolineae bacterium]
MRIGTRRSPLALWQADYVQQLLQAQNQAAELVFFTTQGDQILDKPLPEIGGKGLFTLELEHALREGQIDLAVHSLKDLPTDTPFALAAIPRRASPFDALVSRTGQTLDSLPAGAVIGTSSLRRSAQLKAYRPDLQIRMIRGNVDTRLRKIFDGEYDAGVLAVAGLDRLDKSEVITEIFRPEVMLPAPGQGAIAVQCRANDTALLELLARLDDATTRACVTAERAFLQKLESGCRLPVSAYATLNADGLELTGRVSAVDGTKAITVKGQAVEESAALGIRLAEEALAQGAGELLA